MSLVKKPVAKKAPAKKAAAKPAVKKAPAKKAVAKKPVAKKAVAKKPATPRRHYRTAPTSSFIQTMPDVQRRAGTSGRRTTSGEALDDEKSLSRALISEVDRTGADVGRLCQVYGLKREELGRLTGFSLRALAEWSTGKLPSAPAKRRLHEVRRMLDALGEIVEPSAIPVWLHRPNTTFENLTPLQLIEVGEMDRLWHMVHDLRSGQPV